MKLIECNFIGCQEEATTDGYVYGHIRDSEDKDSFLKVSACDIHAKHDSFYPAKEK
ncbi:hypothetical protein [Paenibacillus lautus]|uniref:hypothetical protein n=1 Tax=Paenibacillus lautus TaxID=1401 RepID=UPI001C7DD1BB|nr:hypothetical protein [Paenibacillus lautus]MBX4152416.1 hypothetical protein [Paenibacillus lautus]